MLLAWTKLSCTAPAEPAAPLSGSSPNRSVMLLTKKSLPGLRGAGTTCNLPVCCSEREIWASELTVALQLPHDRPIAPLWAQHCI